MNNSNQFIIINLEENRNQILNVLIEELETEKMYNNQLLKVLCMNRDTGTIVRKILPHNLKNITTDIFNKLIAKFELIKMANGMLHETIKYLKYPGCHKFIQQRNRENLRVISMCIYRKIGDAQFHIAICRSVKSIVHDILHPEDRQEKLSLMLHQAALKATGAKRFFAPPVGKMAEILAEAFDCTPVPTWEGADFMVNFNYAGFGFKLYQRILIWRFWPRIVNDNFKTYCIVPKN